MNGVVIFLLWIYEYGLKFYNNIYNLRTNTREYILKTVFNDNASAIGVYRIDMVWTTIYDYETEYTLYLILLYIRFKLGLVIVHRNTKIIKDILANHKFSVVTSYDKEGVRKNTIDSLITTKTETIDVDIGYALIGDVDITTLLKSYQSSISKINISVKEFIIILKNKHEMNIKEDATLTIFNVDKMEEQIFKGDQYIDI